MVRMLSILLCVCFVACSGRRGQTESEDEGLVFPDSVEAQWTFLVGGDDMPVRRAMAATDSCIYVLGELGRKWVHAYNVNDGEWVGSYVDRYSPIGNITDPWNITIDRTTGEVGVFNRQLLDRYLIKYSSDFKPEKLYNPDSIVTVNDLLLLSGDRMLGTMLVFGEDGQPKGRVVPCLLSIRDGISKLSECDDSTFVRLKGLPEMMAVSPSSDKIAYSGQNGGTLELYKIVNDSIIKTFCKTFLPIEEKMPGFARVDPELRYGFQCIAATDDNVYIAYSDSKTEKDPMMVIGVWDWEGNPVKKIKTDKSIYSMCVSPDGHRLYCITPYSSQGYAINFLKI